MSEAQSTEVQLAEDQLTGWTRIPKRGKLIALKKILDDGSWITIHPFIKHNGCAWLHRGPEIDSDTQSGVFKAQGAAASIAEAVEKIDAYLKSLNETKEIKPSEDKHTNPAKPNSHRHSRAKKAMPNSTTQEESENVD